jgi:hypothetical protein
MVMQTRTCEGHDMFFGRRWCEATRVFPLQDTTLAVTCVMGGGVLDFAVWLVVAYAGTLPLCRMAARRCISLRLGVMMVP